ncbi:MAG: hypothetical protein IE909_12425 [Campylobacterales bacterium]|nr:hypothetical protein [Campylobacterales bacterium]
MPLSFLISSVYFRSSWKYRNRSIQYILLDSGHSLGAIYAALCAMGKDSQINFEFDKLTLNDMFGFRDDAMFIANIASTTQSKTLCKPLKRKFPFVPPSDHLESNEFIETTYKNSANYSSNPIEQVPFLKDIPKEQLKNAILNRRSIRAFTMKSISKGEFEFIIEDIFSFAQQISIEIFYTLHRVDEIEQGIYKKWHTTVKR